MICANCQHPLPMTVATCPHCGKSPRRAAGASPVKQPKLASAPTEVERRSDQGKGVMYCMKCGQQLPDDANFCMKCGASQRGREGTGDERERYVLQLKNKRYVVTNSRVKWISFDSRNNKEVVYKEVLLRNIIHIEERDFIFKMVKLVGPPGGSDAMFDVETREQVYELAQAIRDAMAGA